LTGRHLGGHPLTDYISKINKKLGFKRNQYFKPVRKQRYCLEANVQKTYRTLKDEASLLYETARHYFNIHTMDSLEAGLKLARDAMKEYPMGDPRTLTVIGYSYLNLGHIGYCVRRPGVAMPLARRAAKAAIKQNEKLARAHGLLGLISLIYDFDWKTAEEKLQEALKLNADEPGALLAYSHLLISSGRTTEGIERIDRAVHAVPTEPIITVSRGWLHVLAGDLTEGLSLCEKACEAYRKLGPAHILLGFAYELNNRPKDAIASYRESLRIEPSAVGLSWLGHLYGKLGKQDLSMGTLKKIKELRQVRKIAYEPAYCKALVYAGLNRTQEAARQLKKARTEHCDWLIHLGVDPRWSPLKKEPVFEEVLEEVGLRTPGG
jgi:tetratricopeptide (TPR) repeat protein